MVYNMHTTLILGLNTVNGISWKFRTSQQFMHHATFEVSIQLAGTKNTLLKPKNTLHGCQHCVNWDKLFFAPLGDA